MCYFCNSKNQLIEQYKFCFCPVCGKELHQKYSSDIRTGQQDEYVDIQAIQEKMHLLNFTHQDLVRRTNLSKSIISCILSGKERNPTIQTMMAIARALNTTVDALLVRTPVFQKKDVK